jgi:aromatic ring-opening dioxygenase catalytic subunit (LigB family)
MPPMTQTRLPTYFVSHGGGPWPWLDGDIRRAYVGLEQSLKAMPGEVGGLPRAILMVTGHWETAEFAVSAAAAPGMIYDYVGFPEHTYHIRYPAPGDPVLAMRVVELLGTAGLAASADGSRGFDHGTFSVMQAMRPEADVPVVQLSLRRDMDPAAHILAGKALAPLRNEGILIVGSGLSYHNLRLWGAPAAQPSAEFDAWLEEVLVREGPAVRESMLLNWTQAPAARIAHPREDHLLPLMVAVGAASEEAGTCVYHDDDFMGSITVSSFRFG